MKELIGKWRLDYDKHDNFEEYLKAIGINYAFRKVGKQVVPTEELQQVDDDTWSLYMMASVRHSRLVFKFGQEIHETTLDGRKCISTFQLDEDGVLIQHQKCISNRGVPDSIIKRKRADTSTLIQEYEVVGTGVRSTRRFKLLES